MIINIRGRAERKENLNEFPNSLKSAWRQSIEVLCSALRKIVTTENVKPLPRPHRGKEDDEVRGHRTPAREAKADQGNLQRETGKEAFA